ncbi:urea carboxylase-associated family protein [Nesterenkonia sp. AN1]|uniref:urea carboxylase-associated family protein n=1 Tax=Nesterenkonia sp. AN1 TaxID=652017 RepID=UPI0004AF3EBB|nr:urea carboxylase-associated family protein [Nesterenkonia sp. AN1]
MSAEIPTGALGAPGHSVRTSRTYNQPAAYQSAPGGPLDSDRSFYDAVAAAERTLTQEFEIPVRSGHAWEVKAGSIVRINAVQGPQVGDLNLWNLHNPRERFWAARTRQLQRASMTTYDRFWSTLPHLRPMATVVGDSLADHPTPRSSTTCWGPAVIPT